MKPTHETKVVRIRIADVQVLGNRRELVQDKVREIAESIKSIGLIPPITVRAVGNAAAGSGEPATVLVAGLHRLEAVRSLGGEYGEYIDAIYVDGDDVDARLREIEENLCRAELTVLQRAEQIDEWVRITEWDNTVSGQVVPKPKGGRPEGSLAKAARTLPLPGGTVAARRKSLDRNRAIARISPQAKAAAKAAALDDNQSALTQIARVAPEAQSRKVEEVADRKRRPREGLPSSGHAKLHDGHDRSVAAKPVGEVAVAEIRAAPEGDDSPGRTAAPDQRDPEQSFADLRNAWEHDSVLTAAWDSAAEAVRDRFVAEVLRMERRHPLVRSEGSLSAERNFWKATREVIRLNPQEDNVRGEFWRAWERLILRRAEDGEPEAQNYVGRLYANVAPPKFVHADMCFILAAAQGNRDAAKSHSRLARKMTPDQSAEAERLAAERQKAHGQKPNK